MEKRMIKKLLAILMIITILSADFFILGSGLISYATENAEDSYADVHFSAYFEEGETNINESIRNKELKLYAEVAINNEQAYLDDVKISLQESDFNIKTLNGELHEGNEIDLNRIDTTSGTVELGIEPILSEKISSDMILTAKVKLDAKYKSENSLEGEDFTKTVEIAVNYQPDENATAELETEIITNKVFTLNDGTNKRIIQLSVKSRLNDNHYPIKETILDIEVPKIDGITLSPDSETNDVISLGNPITYETSEDGTMKIIIQNPIDDNKQISWNKNGYDEVIITYIYEENFNVETVEIQTDSQIVMSNGGVVSSQEPIIAIIEEETEKGIINIDSQIATPEMYKGQLYANATATEKKDITFSKETTLIATNTDVVSKVTITEGTDVFVKNDQTEIEAKTKYLSTEIDIAQMLEVLGRDGNITIRNAETQEELAIINANTTNGLIEYNNSENLPSELYIETNALSGDAGKIELKHTKVILGNQDIDRKTLQEVKELKTNSSVTGIMVVENVDNKIVENSTEARLSLNETMSKATLTVGNDKQLKTGETTENVSLTIDLITNGEQYDLYKNPQIILQFPQAVEDVKFAEIPEIKNVIEGDTISIAYYKWDEVSKTVNITIQGEQKEYPTSVATQLYIPLKLDITVSKLASTQTGEITMTYTNANALQYEEEGTVTETIGISGPGKLVTMFNLGSKETMSSEDIVTQQVIENVGKTITLETILFNDTSSNMQNVRILGYLPTTGNTVQEQENTLETVLTSIEATGANIYYTENVDATADSSSDDWTQELSALTNAKMYLIELETLDVGIYTVKTNIKMPDTITENAISYTKYQVIYDTNTEKDKTVQSGTIGLATSAVATLNTTITAEVGGDILNDGDVVKEGEVIRYTVTAKNNGSESLENVIVKARVPKGTIKVEPIENSAYDFGYYKEIEGSEDTEISFGPITLDEIKEFVYEVRVNKGTARNEILNKSTVVYNNLESQSEEFTNKVEEGNLRVTIKSLTPNNITKIENVEYYITVENLSDKVINDCELEVISSVELNGISIIDYNDVRTYYGEMPDTISINEIPAKSSIRFEIFGNVKEETTNVETYAVITDSNSNQYRSNKFGEQFVNPNVEINEFSSNVKNGGKILEGNELTYRIKLTNTGNVAGTFTIKDKIDYYLKIKQIKQNGKIVQQISNKEENTYQEVIPNNVEQYIWLDVGSTGEIEIKCEVITTPEESQVITNKADIYYESKYLKSSEEIKHTLAGTSEPSGQIKNIISGFVWLDKNENGQKDSNENALSGIIVKLYNNSTNNYITGTDGNIIQKITNNNGSYTLSGIEDGSYKVVFEYDMNKYELTENCKAQKQDVTINEQTVTIIATNEITVTNHVSNINIGLKEKAENGSDGTGEGGDGTGDVNTENRNTISGFAWIDTDRDGLKDSREKGMSGVKVRLYVDSTKSYLKDENGKIVEIKTDEDGKYTFNNIESGKYIVLFNYDMEEYEPTKYLTDGDSKVVLKKIEIEGKEETFAITDIINVQSNISNINIGLREKLIFDLELDKYISRIVVQNSKETKTYNYENATLAKVEIHRKRVQGSLVVLEYTIKVRNNGEVAGYAKNIVDYLPSGLTFSSELNKDWYLSGDYLHTKGLENVVINPGEEKEVKLILTKTMTNENTGLINNRAEIYQDYNDYGNIDIDSTPNNQAQNEDDLGSVDVIIGPATGGNTTIYIMLLIINIILIGIAIKLMIKNNIIKISTKRERR